MLYIVLDGNKQYLSREIVEKYGLKAGMYTPFTGCEVFEDGKNEEEISSGNQKIYQAPEDDNPNNGQ